MKWEFSYDGDTEDEAVGVARVFRAVPPDDVPSPRINSPRTVRGTSFVSTEWDQASMESNERVFDARESWMDVMATGPPQECGNGSDAVGASGGDGGRGGVAPPGVSYSSCAKGVGKGKVRDEIRPGMTPIIQPFDTNVHQEVRRQ